MVLPALKTVVLLFKTISKPLNNFIKELVRHNGTRFKPAFMYLGNLANRIEIKVNRKLINPNTSLDFVVKPLKPEPAFNKGVDLFVEIVFLYGIGKKNLQKANF